MNMGVVMPSPQVREAAEDWFARLRAPDCDAAQRAAFEAWRVADPLHAQAYAATVRLWSQLEALKGAREVRAYELEALAPAGRPRQSLRPAARARRWRMPVALAAALVLAVVGYQFLPAWLTPAQQRYAATDRPSDVVLADGSRVHLDVDTHIAVRLARKQRHVELERGRALFTVVRDAGRPFTVAAANGSVTVLGTRFQVWREGARVTVTLVEGAVAVHGPAAPGGAGQEARLLRPGDELRYSPSGVDWELRQVDPEAAVSWSEGRLMFRAAALESAVAEINRYSRRKILLADAALAELRLSGTFRAGDAASVATALPAVLPVRVEQAPGGDIVLHLR